MTRGYRGGAEHPSFGVHVVRGCLLVLGLLFVAPYLAIFVGFVVFPVGYAFWLARSPRLYVELANDPPSPYFGAESK